MAETELVPARSQTEGRVHHVQIPEDCRFFTAAQVTAMLGCSRHFLYKICKSNQGPPMIRWKIGGRAVIRFPIIAFREWMASATKQSGKK